MALILATTARAAIVDVLVATGVALELVCCLGLVAMRNTLDRLHFAAAATTVGPVLIATAVCVREGLFTTNGLNAVLVAAMLALLGTVLTHGTARLARGESQGLESTPAERERGS